MEKVQLFEAKARLSELVARAEAGREIIITRRGRAIDQLRKPRFRLEQLDFFHVNSYLVNQVVILA